MTLNIVMKVILICFICFNMWGHWAGQSYDASPKIGPKSRQKLVIRPDYRAGESGIPSENLGCSG